MERIELNKVGRCDFVHIRTFRSSVGFCVCIEKWDCRYAERRFAQPKRVWVFGKLGSSVKDEEESKLGWSKEKSFLGRVLDFYDLALT